jgi:hypothetical protein
VHRLLRVPFSPSLGVYTVSSSVLLSLLTFQASNTVLIIVRYFTFKLNIILNHLTIMTIERKINKQIYLQILYKFFSSTLDTSVLWQQHKARESRNGLDALRDLGCGFTMISYRFSNYEKKNSVSISCFSTIINAKYSMTFTNQICRGWMHISHLRESSRSHKRPGNLLLQEDFDFSLTRLSKLCFWLSPKRFKKSEACKKL